MVLPGYMPNDESLLNAGVIGIDKARDYQLLNAWVHLVMQAANRPDIRALISWHDQGALIWAVRMCNLQHRILAQRWNYPVRSIKQEDSVDLFRKYAGSVDLFGELSRDFPEANILHWNGLSCKLWHS